MSRFHQAYLAYQQARWLRGDAARFVRPDAARFLKPGTRLKDIYPALRKYNSNQPRVPAGSGRESGRWTNGSGGQGRPRIVIDTTDWGSENDSIGVLDAARGEVEFDLDGGSTLDAIFASHDSSPIYDPSLSRTDNINDFRVISDANPEVVKPGAQYAQAGRNRSATSVRINGQTVELSPAHAARLEVVRSRAEELSARVREIDPNWKPAPSAYETADGLIRAYEANAIQARQRLNELASRGIGSGPFAGESIPARNSQRSFTLEERALINSIGELTGCHTCGTRNPGTPSGNFVIDHQNPTALNGAGRAQRLFPHCLTCSLRQGGYVNSFGRHR